MIAITGSIGTGKSTVCTIIKSMGYNVVDCDKLVHHLYLEKEIINQVKELFPDVVDNGFINRKKLGSIIFNNKAEKEKLENLIHPYVRKELNKIKDKKTIVEIQLLFESHMEDLFDVIICVASDAEVQIDRIIKRNNISKESALKIINNQMDINKKIELSDFVIYNNLDMNQLIKDTKELMEKIEVTL